MANPKRITLEFEFERDTTATYRYKEITERGKRGAVGTLYVTKDFMKEFGWDQPETPVMLEVTIEVLDAKKD